MTQHQTIALPASAPRTPGVIHTLITRIPPTLMRLARTALDAADRRRQRRALSKLDDRLLQDIGISREQAMQEARRLF